MSAALAYADFAQQARRAPIDAAIMLGSGMSGLAGRCQRIAQVAFADVPGLPATSIAGHSGRLTLGDWAGKRILILEGRLHYYEGHSWSTVVRPIEVAHSLGARVLLLTNAAGGIHDALGPGSLMVVCDHIEWTQPGCWRLPGPGALGPPRPSPYAPRLTEQLGRAAGYSNIELHCGVYAAVLGPCYETPAEILALRCWGADAVGMSTAREIQTGCDLGMECAALSCITNRAAGLGAGPINHEEVLAIAAAQTERLAELLQAFIRLLD